MNKREHFEQWMRYGKPNMPLYYNDQEGYYYHDMAQGMWMAWQAASGRRPTEDSKITAEQLKADDPHTIVDRLNGRYPTAVDPYPVSPIQKEAAREIERLVSAMKDICEKVRSCNYTMARSDALTILASHRSA